LRQKLHISLNISLSSRPPLPRSLGMFFNKSLLIILCSIPFSLVALSGCQTQSQVSVSSSSDGGSSNQGSELAAPNIALQGLTQGYTNSNQVSTQLISSASGIQAFCISYSQSTTPAANCTGGMGSAQAGYWSTSFPANISTNNSTDGEKTIYVWLRDTNGQVSTNFYQSSFIVDTTAPTIGGFVTVPVLGTSIANSTEFEVSGSCSDGGIGVATSGIKICAKNGTCTSSDFTHTTNCESGVFSKTISSITEGTWSIEIMAEDSLSNSSTTQSLLANVTIDQTPPSTLSFQSPTVDTTITGASFTFDWMSATDSDTGLHPSSPYIVNLYANGNCSGSPIESDTATTSDFTPSTALVDGQTYSLQAMSQDAAGNKSSATCSSSITRDVSAPTLAISDSTSSSASETNDQTIDVSITSGSAAKWCLSETQTSPPTDGSTPCNGGTGWVGTAPTSFVLSSGDGTKTVYLWIADGSNVVYGSSVTSSIYLDETAPLASIYTSPSSNSNSADAVFTFSSTDSGRATTEYVYSCNVDSAGDSSCTSPLSLSGLSEGAHDISITVSDAAGNVSAAATYNWTVDLTPPSLSLEKESIHSNQDTVTFTGSCEDGLTITVSGYESTTTTCTSNSFSFTTTSVTSDSEATYLFSQEDAAGNTTQTSGSFVRDTLAPSFVASSFSIDNGIANASSRIVSVDFSASDSASPIKELCLKWSTSTTPSADDGCWIRVDDPASPNVQPSQSISVTDHPISLGFGSSNYTVRGWLKDSAGNISSLENGGTGVSGNDSDSIFYSPGTPPVLSSVIVANSNAPTAPIDFNDLDATSGASVFAKWTLTDDQALPGSPLTIEYTTDGVNYTQIGSTLSNGVNGSCTIDDAGTSLDDNATGCAQFLSPTSSAYSLRIIATDSAGLTSAFKSSHLNFSGFNLLAGNLDKGDGGTAANGIFFSQGTTIFHFYANSLVVTSKGVVFFRDIETGLYRIDPSDGVMELLVPTTGTSSGDGGPASSAEFNQPAAIYLDKADNVLIRDYNLIRRINTSESPMTIETIIGGGAQTSDGTLATDFQLDNWVLADNQSGRAAARRSSLFTLKNGDIYFHAGDREQVSYAGNYYKYYDASDGRIYSLNVSGTGHSELPAIDITDCDPGELSPIYGDDDSTPEGYISYLDGSAGYTNCTSHGMTRLDATGVVSTSTITGADMARHHKTIIGQDNETYLISRVHSSISKFNKSTNSFDTLFDFPDGESSCADGTHIESCAMMLNDMFVSKDQKFYFLDKTMIRTLDDSDNLVTLLGQSPSSGDGSLASNARIAFPQSVHFWDDAGTTKVIFNDISENKIREFSIGGNIATIGGNGVRGTPNEGETATASPLIQLDQFEIDPSNGNVFVPADSNRVLMLDRADGVYDLVIGGGATSYNAADGSVGADVNLGPNTNDAKLVSGFENGQLLLKVADGEDDIMLKAYDSSDSFRQSSVAGITGTTTSVSLDYVRMALLRPLVDLDLVPLHRSLMTHLTIFG
jgi:hypothetical protein